MVDPQPWTRPSPISVKSRRWTSSEDLRPLDPDADEIGDLEDPR
jgi:hypothetical protein